MKNKKHPLWDGGVDTFQKRIAFYERMKENAGKNEHWAAYYFWEGAIITEIEANKRIDFGAFCGGVIFGMFIIVLLFRRLG